MGKLQAASTPLASVDCDSLNQSSQLGISALFFRFLVDVLSPCWDSWFLLELTSHETNSVRPHVPSTQS